MFAPSLRRLGARSAYMHHTFFGQDAAEATEADVPAAIIIVLR